jgi:hypothetical protein
MNTTKEHTEMSNKEIAVDSTMIEQILDKARDLAEQNGYDFPHSTFNTTDMPYIDKAIGMLKEQGQVPMTKAEQMIAEMNPYGEGIDPSTIKQEEA